MAKILIVDDDPYIRQLLADVLALEGHEIESANDGAAALECIEHGTVPDLIFLDLRMPGVTGAEFLERSRGGKVAATRIWVVTAETDLARTLPPDPRVMGVLHKPFSVSALLRAAALPVAPLR